MSLKIEITNFNPNRGTAGRITFNEAPEGKTKEVLSGAKSSEVTPPD